MIEYTLPSGLVVELNEAITGYTIAGMDLPIPNTALHDILDNLTGGLFGASIDEQNAYMGRLLRGCFELSAVWMVKPRLILRGDASSDDLVPGPDFSTEDAIALWSFFRRGKPRRLALAAAAPGASPEADQGEQSVGEGT